MQTDVRLNALGKGFQDDIHVDSFGILPLMVEGVLHSFRQEFTDSMMLDEIIDTLFHFLQFFGPLIQFDDDRGDTAENRCTQKG